MSSYSPDQPSNAELEIANAIACLSGNPANEEVMFSVSPHMEATCREAIEVWGVVAQLFQTMGECGELIAEINRVVNQGRDREDELIGELADVFVMALQGREIYGHERFQLALERSFQKFQDKLQKLKSEGNANG